MYTKILIDLTKYLNCLISYTESYTILDMFKKVMIQKRVIPSNKNEINEIKTEVISNIRISW